MRGRVWRVAGYLLAVITVVYLADMLVWLARGRLATTVDVTTLTAASQKGNKVEYFPAEANAAPCLVRLFPSPTADGFLPPCWWVRVHRTREQQI